MSNKCTFTVESVAGVPPRGAGAGGGKAGGDGPEPVRLMGGFHTLDHNSEARPSLLAHVAHSVPVHIPPQLPPRLPMCQEPYAPPHSASSTTFHHIPTPHPPHSTASSTTFHHSISTTSRCGTAGPRLVGGSLRGGGVRARGAGPRRRRRARRQGLTLVHFSA